MPDLADDLAGYSPVVPTDLAFSSDAAALSRALETVAPAIGRSGSFPILHEIWMQVAEGVTVSATNQDLTIVAELDADVERPGTGIFPGTRMLEVVRAVGEDSVRLDAAGGKATVTTARTTWEMPLIHPATYPEPPEVEFGGTEIEPKRFHAALQIVRPAMTKDTTRPPLRMVDVSGGYMRASDGVRYVSVALGDVPDMHLPYAAVEHLASLMSNAKGKVAFGESDEQFAYRIGPLRVYTRKLIERFPDVEAHLVTPAWTNNDRKLRIDRAELAEAIRRVRLAADPDSNAVTMRLDRRRIEVRARDTAGNTAREGLGASWDGEEGRLVAFHHQMLSDALRVLEGEEVILRLAKDKRTQRSPMLMSADTVTVVISQLRADG